MLLLLLNQARLCSHELHSPLPFAITFPYRRTLSASPNFRLIFTNTKEWNLSDPNLNSYLRSIQNDLARFAASLVSVTPEQIAINQAACNDCSVPTIFQNTKFDADLIVFMRTYQRMSSNFYSRSAPCLRKLTTPQRIIFASAGWNKKLADNSLIKSNLGYQLLLRHLMHSLFHLLGFSFHLFESFPNQPFLERINDVSYVVSPNVLKQVSNYFSCSGLGMPLQNQNGIASFISSHWQQQKLLDQLMTPESTSADYLFISRITLALLLDSGWYTNVNMGSNQDSYMTFGRLRGCQFLRKDDCSISPEYCPVLNKKSINYYRTAMGVCTNTSFTTCSIVKALDLYNCRTADYKGYLNSIKWTLQYGAWNSKAFSSNLIQLGWMVDQSEVMRCFSQKCSEDRKSLTVNISNVLYLCTESKKIQNSTQFNGRLICPQNITEFCRTQMLCPNHCSKSGVCNNKNCVK